MKNSKIPQDFLEASKVQNMAPSDMSKNLNQPPLQMSYEGDLIDLPSFNDIEMPKKELKEAIVQRKSVRNYPQKALSLEELSYVLYMTQGVKKIKNSIATFRTVPSAGARHAFETYIAINRVDGLKPGLYRYLAIEHKLICIKSEHGYAKKLSAACLDQKSIEEASATLIWIADTYRMTYRYGERGYRYLFLDAGHVCQNLYLIAEQIGCGTCAIAAFDDDKINHLLELDGSNQFTIYLGTLGKL